MTEFVRCDFCGEIIVERFDVTVFGHKEDDSVFDADACRKCQRKIVKLLLSETVERKFPK